MTNQQSATYTVRYNRSSNHIQGLAERTRGTDLDYALSACGTLTRSASKLAVGTSSTDLELVLKSARAAGGRKLCKNCESAALAELAA